MDLPAAAGRRHGKVRAASALRLAAGRHGRPYAGLRADPCRDHGDRRRLHGGPHLGAVLCTRPWRWRPSPGWACATALFAATIGLAQNDIKKVFAYSTVSQLGYMFLGLGVGAFSAGIFHLVTHAFFKALLFLGAGSVIHALGGEQDLRKMGGLRTKIPITFWTMLCAAVAISGVPFTSGFFSKDEILVAAYHHSPVLFWIGAITAGMTAFYVFRAIFLAFFGSPRGPASPARVASRDDAAAGRAGGALVGWRLFQRTEVAGTDLPARRVGRGDGADGDLGGDGPRRHRHRVRLLCAAARACR